MKKVTLQNISVRYITGDFTDIGLKDYVIQKLKRQYHVKEFWAVNDVSFSLEEGDLLGIVGSNGAGKSTLLKVISGIMCPTTGKMSVEGTIASLLELGTGFDGELTVRENTFLRGAMLGYTRKFMDEMYDRIGKPGKGYDLEEGKRIAKRLEELGVDAINVSSACYDTYNYWLEPTSFEPGWRAYLAKAIKETVKIPVCAANFMRSPDQAERQLEEGVQDFIGSARTFICDPYWVKKTEEGRTNEIKRCIGCLNCIESFTYGALSGKNGECALNPAVGQERFFANMPKDGEGRRVVVVGAGPAGLMAAEVMARRGFAVTVFEKEEKAGGQVKTASTCLLKGKLYWSIEDLMANVEKLGVEVKLGTEATEKAIAKLKPYAVVIATGGVPVRPRSIKGIDLPNVCTAPEIIMGEKKISGKIVAVIGSGMTGLETTEILNESGNHVVVVEMAEEIAPGTWFQLKDDELSRIQKYDTEFMPGKRLMKITEDSVILEDVRTSMLTTVTVDEVVLSLGVRPVNALAKALENQYPYVVTVGDACKSGRIADAVHSAYDAVMRIK